MTSLTAHDTTCYRPNANGTVEGTYDSYFTPNTSTNYSPCCFSTATYVTDNVCYQEDHSQGSGFYLALCTDPTYSDASCPKACSSYTKGDIVFTNNQWLCCGVTSDGSPACSDPTTEVVSGLPNLSSMKALLASATTSSNSIATSTRSSTSTQTSATSTSTPSSSSTPQQVTSSGGLTTATKAGIGAGIAIVVVFALVAAFLLMRRKRRNQSDQQSLQSNEKVDLQTPHKYHSEMDSAVLSMYQERDQKIQPSEPVELMSPAPQQRIHEMG